MCDSFAGMRLDVYVSQSEEITRSAAQKRIERGLVTVNGAPCDKNYRLRDGDRVEIDRPEPEYTDAVPQNIPLNIVYEDDDLLVVNKEKGMVVHPAPGHPDGTLVNALLYHCGDSLSAINGVVRPGIIHRLDRDTSGLLMVAKNDRAHVFLAQQLKERHISRRYQAIVIGGFRDESGTVDAPIGRHRTDRKRMQVMSDGREAVTHYRVLSRYSGYTWLELALETGRTHQIRVHMSHIGHPLVGDPVYGRENDPLSKKYRTVLSGQCLHAKTLSFVHPTTGCLMEFDSELPAYFKTVLAALDKTAASRA